MVPWTGERRTGGGEGDKCCLARQGELWDFQVAKYCPPAMMCYPRLGRNGRKEKRKKTAEPVGPGPVCAADSSVGQIATGASTVHAADGAVQHIACCTD